MLKCVSIRFMELWPSVLTMVWWSMPRRVQAPSKASEMKAPPPVALQGKMHHASVDKPILVCRCRFEGMGLRRRFRGAAPPCARDVLIDPSVDGHDTLDSTHREIALAPQTPDAKATGIGMALLQMRDFDHHRQPSLAHRGVWCPALVLHALQVVGLKARHPGVNSGAGDLQKLTDTALTPALCREGNDLHAGLGTLGIAVVVEQGELLRGGGGQLLPQLLHGMVMDAVGQRMKNDARRFAGPEALVEAFEPL